MPSWEAVSRVVVLDVVLPVLVGHALARWGRFGEGRKQERATVPGPVTRDPAAGTVNGTGFPTLMGVSNLSPAIRSDAAVRSGC